MAVASVTELRAHPRPALTLLLGSAVVLAAILRPVLVGNAALVDAVLLCVILHAAFSWLWGERSAAQGLAHRMLPWLWLVLLGSAMSLLGVGFAWWALRTLLVDAFVLAAFVAMYHLASSASVNEVWVRRCAIGAMALVTTLLVQTAGLYRPSATFYNPNYAAHFLVFAAAYITSSAPVRRSTSAAVVGMAMVGLLLTGSYGGMAMLLAGSAYLVVSGVLLSRRLAQRATLIGLVVLLAASSWAGLNVLSSDGISTATGSISTYRFENAWSIRRDIWSAAISQLGSHPLGVGPYGLTSRHLLSNVRPGKNLEVHSDSIAFLVERGPLGLAGLVGLICVLWTLGRRGGPVRLLVVCLVAGGVFRETLHFRHAWLFLGLALAAETAARRQPTGSDV